ncbi:MAG: hypothetical protein M3081_02575, partial [Gemmatimonadota bacterium]|nr:hypothetical protein [Gemmatimonadota bacterium]
MQQSRSSMLWARVQRARFAALIAISAAGALGACHSSDSVGIVPVSTVTLSAAATTLAAGGTLQLTV